VSRCENCALQRARTLRVVAIARRMRAERDNAERERAETREGTRP
jgi:hypothetical protein